MALLISVLLFLFANANTAYGKQALWLCLWLWLSIDRLIDLYWVWIWVGIGFAYSGPSGPEFWGSLLPEWGMCSSGQSQSPINIVDKEAIKSNLKPREVDLLEVIVGQASLLLSGHDVGVTLSHICSPFHPHFSFSVLRPLHHDSCRLNGRVLREITVWEKKFINSITCISIPQVNMPSMVEGNVPIRVPVPIWFFIFIYSNSSYSCSCRYPLEMHKVHVSSNGQISVIGVLFEYGEPDVFLNPVQTQTLSIVLSIMQPISIFIQRPINVFFLFVV